MDYKTDRYALQRFSVPEPKYDGSPAKVRSSDLRWLHYPDSYSSRLVLEVKSRPPSAAHQASSSAMPLDNPVSGGYNGYGPQRARYPGNDDCLISVYCGSICYQRVSVDSYRVAYEAAHQLNHSAARGRDEYGSRVAVDDLETIKVTVKEPSVAFRLLQPLGQAYNERDHSKPFSDYTYDRFQVKFKAQQDMESFLRTLYSYFPAIEPSPKLMGTRSGSVDSVAPSQNTQIYIPGFQLVRRNRSNDTSRTEEPTLHGEKGKAYDEDLSPAKRWMNMPRQDSCEREWELIGEFPKDQVDSYDGRPSLQQTVRESQFFNHTGIAIGGKYERNRPLRREARQQPPGSVDQDGFVKPFAPAVIDTPTPANRFYHLKPIDPNTRKGKGPVSQLSVVSPSKKSMHDVYADAALVVRDLSPDLPHKLPGEQKNAGTSHSDQQYARLPSIGMVGSIAEREEDLDESLSVPTGMTQIVLGWKAEQEARRSEQEAQEKAKNRILPMSPTKASPHSLRHILAPETIPTEKPRDDLRNIATDPSSAPTSNNPWPLFYAAQNAISPSATDIASGVLDIASGVLDTHKTAQRNSIESKDKTGNYLSAQNHGIEAKQANNEASVSDAAPMAVGNSLSARAPTTPIPHQGVTMEEVGPNLITQPLIANITQVSTLYTLSADDLDDAINEILAEPGFIPFVENLQSCWRARVSLLTGNERYDPSQKRDE